MKDILYILLNVMEKLGEVATLILSAIVAISGDMEKAIYMMLILLYLKK